MNERLDNFATWLESDRIMTKTQLTRAPMLFMSMLYCILGLPWGSVVKDLPSLQEMPVWSLGWEDPLE